MLSSSSSHSQNSNTSVSFSSRSKSQRRVAFENVDVVEFPVEWGDQPNRSNNGPLTIRESEKAERRAFILSSHEYEIEQYRHSAPELYMWREDRMRRLQSNLKLSFGPSLSAATYPEWPEMEERIQEVNQRVDSLLERMEILDQNMARQGRRRQRRQRARRSALVWAHMGASSSSLESL